MEKADKKHLTSVGMHLAMRCKHFLARLVV